MLVNTGQPEVPAYFEHDAVVNRKLRPVLEDVLAGALQPLSLEEAIRLGNSGVTLLDVRDSQSYALAHVPGSLHIGLDGKFATWCGSLLRPDQSLVIIGACGQEQEAATRLGRIGFDRVIGFVHNLQQEFAQHSHLLASVRRIDACDLAKMRKGTRAPVILDVRSAEERQSNGFITGSMHIPLQKLGQQLAQLHPDQQIVVQCASGYRSSIAASLLLRAGFTQIVDLNGGYSAWSAQPKQAVPAHSKQA